MSSKPIAPNTGLQERLLHEALEHAQSAGLRRRETYAMSMIGRLDFLIGNLENARDRLSRSIELAEENNWLAFVPWPQAFLGETLVEMGAAEEASRILRQAFARACQIGDPCWEAVTGRALAMISADEGDSDEALRIVEDALERCRRLPDTYKWGEAYVLEARCRLGVRQGHPDAEAWIEELLELSSRTGMRELQLQAMLLASELTGSGLGETVDDLIESIGNPRFSRGH